MATTGCDGKSKKKEREKQVYKASPALLGPNPAFHKFLKKDEE